MILLSSAIRPSLAIACSLFIAASVTSPASCLAEAKAAKGAKNSPARVDFNRDIQPILSNNCFFCHGPDPEHREAELRLDLEGAAKASREGHAAVIPGKPDESELIKRITSADVDLVMPPPDSHKKLSPKQKELLRQWIAEGAEYQTHWAYGPLRRPTPPAITNDVWKSWPRGDIDRFILARLLKEKLSPAAEADAATLCRRLYFDLLGLPPTPEEVEDFVTSYGATSDDREAAYARLVDKLLASPHFGERMAMWWLDLVRYADTVGYHGDQNISVWPFRDYVIKSFNDNKPLDRFTVEQLAGDLLPNATRETLVASGYNRLGMMTAEGGAQDKEYLAKYAAERVRNVSGVWMGATVGCAECHDHKFDPYSSRDFYSLAAFFADIKEKGFYGGANVTGDWGPKLLLTTAEQDAEFKKLDADIAQLTKTIDERTPEAKKQYATWEKQHRGRAVDGAPNIPKDIRTILRDDSGKRSTDVEAKLYAFFLGLTQPQLAKEVKALQALNAKRKQLENSIPWTLVSEATEPRPIRVLARGNWMDDTGPIVTPAVPAFLPQSQQSTSPTNPSARLTRLDLAHWLMSPDNPLTARVFANRFWAMLFGVGLSKRLDDFGAQGEPPVHPELLDYLALTLRDGGWDVKAALKQIVLSSTYRQASTADAAIVAADPYNRLYARQGRFRLPAESVRDRALAASGLLSKTIGGRSVRPYQPAGYYAQLNFPKREYQQDTGENLWRRSVYTHWQRTFLHPAMQAFDAPSREECTCERVRSNTPLQSLVLLNDPEFVEAARALAERVLLSFLSPKSSEHAAGEGPGVSGGPTQGNSNSLNSEQVAAIHQIYRFALQRSPSKSELDLLIPLYDKHLSFYSKEHADAKQLVEIGERPTPPNLDVAELAALTNVARAVLNTHEFVTRD